MIFYNNSSSLTHHGIKGQKWGVRRFQNKDGTYTSAGKKRYAGKVDEESSRALNDALFNRHRNEELSSKKFDQSIEELNKKYGYSDDIDRDYKKYREWYFNKDGTRSEKSLNYSKEYEKIYEDYRNENAWRKDMREEENNWRTVQNNKALKTMMKNVKETLKKMDEIEENTIGENSKAYKEAFQKYKERHKSDPDLGNDTEALLYGFDHEVWREGNKDYDRAYAQYTQESKKLNEANSSQVRELMRKGLGEKTYKSLSKEQLETGEAFVNSRIRFRFED